MKLELVFTAAAVSLCVAACYREPEKTIDSATNLNSSDKRFVEKIAENNLVEIEMSQLGSTRAQAEVVRSYSARLLSDYNAAQEELPGVIARYENVRLPERLSAADAQQIQELLNLPDETFDSAYIAVQLKYQRIALTLFEQVIDRKMASEVFQGNQNDPPRLEIADYAENYYPQVKRHMAMADSIRLLINSVDFGN